MPRRRLVWYWLLLAWLPVWALFVALMLSAHPETRVVPGLLVSLRMIVSAAVVGLAVPRLVARFPWPHPFRVRFALLHLAAAVVYAAAWVLLNSLIASVLEGALVLVIGGAGLGAFLVLGVWIYLIIAGVGYAARATERAAHAEAAAARAQLAALRAQLEPHFLFNALHTVVQLIPTEPGRAAWATEQLAAMMRTTLEEDRDLVSLAEEWRFVEHYLEIERIRFGDRLLLETTLDAESLRAALPSFALQTLVENALRHGVGRALEPTTVTVTAVTTDGTLTVRVQDSGPGASPQELAAGGSGLARLRDRLEALYGGTARLELDSAPGEGFRATLVLPQDEP